MNNSEYEMFQVSFIKDKIDGAVDFQLIAEEWEYEKRQLYLVNGKDYYWVSNAGINEFLNEWRYVAATTDAEYIAEAKHIVRERYGFFNDEVSFYKEASNGDFDTVSTSIKKVDALEVEKTIAFISSIKSREVKKARIVNEVSPHKENAKEIVNTKKETYPEKITRKIITMLENGTAPWIKPWEPNELLCPHNPVTGTVYKGFNAIYLTMASAVKGSDDPRWMTFNQIRKSGNKLHLKAGSRAVTIAFYQPPLGVNITKETVDTDNTEFVKGTRPIYKYYNVFNASDIEGMPPLDKEKIKNEFSNIESCDTIIVKSRAIIKHDQGDRAFYSPSLDEIHLPQKEYFKSPPYYYATALHELGHWTGHEERLNRNLSGMKWTPSYAREELVAELTSYLLSMETGLPHDPGQHASYIGSWAKLLKEKNTEIFKAAGEAERAKNFLLGFNNRAVKSINVESGKKEMEISPYYGR